MEEAGKATSIYLLAWLPASDSQSQGNRNGGVLPFPHSSSSSVGTRILLFLFSSSRPFMHQHTDVE
jgi:hypothetical protein